MVLAQHRQLGAAGERDCSCCIPLARAVLRLCIAAGEGLETFITWP